ncbi:MAG TPA: SusC/RagA family TonB-linked outer membrane protein [Chitinophagaceae bacterium]|nr:SusC/RagA family TonB-linked outer membrane protein [Chitinophagaceae bacterium]
MIKTLALLTAFLFFTGLLFAQRTITGKVTDNKGNPISNVSVLIKGTTTGTTTKIDGSYSLNVPANAKAIVFSSVNMTTIEVPIKNENIVNASLQSEDKTLSEVVVVGYGTQKKSNLTASVSKVGGDKLENKPFTSVDQMLQGASAGLQSTATTGQPGANQPIRIRGVGSFSYAGAQPLYIIDGVQINSGDIANGNGGGFNINPSTNVLATLNSDDIESISVLKDAAATSIYGSRGGNGVIIITTKSGKAGKTQFKFDMEMGNNHVILPPLLGRPVKAADWFTLLKEGMVNRGSFSQATIDATMASYGYGNGVDIDWFNLVTRPGTQQQYNLSASGGDSKNKFFFSGGYFRQQGTTLGADLKRITGNIKYTHTASDNLSFTTKLTVGNVDQNSVLASSGPSGGGGYFGNPDYVALVLRPTQNPYNSDGTLNISGNNFGFPAHYNPLYIAANDKRWLKAFNGLGNEIVEYKILNGLKFTSNMGLQYSIDEEYQYNNPFHGDGSGTATNGEGISIFTRNFVWDWINQFDYHLDINKTQNFYVDIKAGYEAIKNRQFSQIGDVISFPPKVDLYLSANGATSQNGKAFASDYAFNGYFSNASFSYKDKYSLYGSFRRDASSRFGINNPWGNFASFGLAWNVSNEDFFKNMDFISALKLRASYGTNGNAEIGNYTWRPLYSFGYNYNGIAGGTFDNIGNVDLTWEKNKQTDIGIDLGLFKNRINITADYYKRTTKGSLLSQPVSRTTGFTGFINNVGNLENNGIEITLNATPVQAGDFSWQINFNYSHNTSKVTALPSGNQDLPSGAYLLRVGQSFYSFYTRAWAGVDPATGNPQWYTDSTRSAKTTSFSAAKQFLVGKSALPKTFGSLGNTFSYKNFSASIDFYYNYGNYFQEAYSRFFLDGSFPTRGRYSINLTRWQKPGDITDVPKYIYGDGSNAATGSDRLLFKGDYIRLRNVQVMYRLTKKEILQKLHVTALSFYVRGTNLWRKTYDPRLLSDPEQGILGVNNQEVPPSRSMTAGLSLTF